MILFIYARIYESGNNIIGSIDFLVKIIRTGHLHITHAAVLST